MIQEPSAKFRSESNDSRTLCEVPIWIKWFKNPLQSSDLNQKIHKLAPKFQSKLNDLQYALLSPDLNQMICNMQSSDVNLMIRDPLSVVPIWGAFPKRNYGHKFCHYQKSLMELATIVSWK